MKLYWFDFVWFITVYLLPTFPCTLHIVKDAQKNYVYMESTFTSKYQARARPNNETTFNRLALNWMKLALYSQLPAWDLGLPG